MSEPWPGGYRKDGRKIMDPRCAQGHHSQAMECPDCSERVTGTEAGPEWRAWYAKRYARDAATPPTPESETPMSPQTEAGRTFLAALQAMDAIVNESQLTPVDWAHGILAIEQEVRADIARQIAALGDLRALSDAATLGPWASLIDDYERSTLFIGTANQSDEHWFIGSTIENADAAFIVAAVNYVRAALAAQPEAPARTWPGRDDLEAMSDAEVNDFLASRGLAVRVVVRAAIGEAPTLDADLRDSTIRRITEVIADLEFAAARLRETP